MNLQILSKKLPASVGLIVGLLGAIYPAAGQQRSGFESSRGFTCTNATLKGRYAAISSIHFVPSGPPPAPLVPGAIVGVMTLDGAGHLSFQATISQNGEIKRQVQFGTYTVKADCTGQMTLQPTDLPFPITNDLVVATLEDGAQGTEFYTIGTTPGGIVPFTAKRIQ